MHEKPHGNLFAIKWSILDKVYKRGYRFVISLVLARLLTPDEFGVVAMASVFIAFSVILTDFGVGQAIICCDKLEKVQLNTLFLFNLILGVCAALVIYFSSPAIGRFYHNPLVGQVAMVIGLNLLINSTTVVHNNLFHKTLNYRVGTKANLISGISSGVLGIILALSGFGVWSLVAQAIASTVIRTMYLWWVSPWKPEMQYDFKATYPVIKMGINFLKIGLVNQLFDRLDTLVIGKYYSSYVLGNFNRGKSMNDLVRHTFILPITRPFFPIFSKEKKSSERVSELFYNSSFLLSFFSFGMFLFLFMYAKETLVFLYSSKWVYATDYLKYLAILGLFYPLYDLATSIFKSHDSLKLLLRFTFIERALSAVGLVLGVVYDIKYYLFTLIIVFCTMTSLRVYFVSRILPIRIRRYIQYYVAFFAVAMFSSLPKFFNIIFFDNFHLNYLAHFSLFFASYAAILAAIYRVKLAEVVGFIMKRITKQQTSP